MHLKRLLRCAQAARGALEFEQDFAITAGSKPVRASGDRLLFTETKELSKRMLEIQQNPKQLGRLAQNGFETAKVYRGEGLET